MSLGRSVDFLTEIIFCRLLCKFCLEVSRESLNGICVNENQYSKKQLNGNKREAHCGNNMPKKPGRFNFEDRCKYTRCSTNTQQHIEAELQQLAA